MDPKQIEIDNNLIVENSENSFELNMDMNDALMNLSKSDDIQIISCSFKNILYILEYSPDKLIIMIQKGILDILSTHYEAFTYDVLNILICISNYRCITLDDKYFYVFSSLFDSNIYFRIINSFFVNKNITKRVKEFFTNIVMNSTFLCVYFYSSGILHHIFNFLFKNNNINEEICYVLIYFSNVLLKCSSAVKKDNNIQLYKKFISQLKYFNEMYYEEFMHNNIFIEKGPNENFIPFMSFLKIMSSLSNFNDKNKIKVINECLIYVSMITELFLFDNIEILLKVYEESNFFETISFIKPNVIDRRLYGNKIRYLAYISSKVDEKWGNIATLIVELFQEDLQVWNLYIDKLVASKTDPYSDENYKLFIKNYFKVSFNLLQFVNVVDIVPLILHNIDKFQISTKIIALTLYLQISIDFNTCDILNDEKLMLLLLEVIVIGEDKSLMLFNKLVKYLKKGINSNPSYRLLLKNDIYTQLFNEIRSVFEDNFKAANVLEDFINFQNYL